MGILKFIETYIASADQLNDDGVPSVSMAILNDPSGAIESHVISKGRENTESIYQACSISKAITALTVARLVDLEKLTYETKVIEVLNRNIWKDIVDHKTEHLMQYVTVGHLLSHRSGLSQQHFEGYPGEVPAYEQFFAGRPPSNTPRIRFLSCPGSQFHYSGGGYTLLQVLMETLMDMSFADIVRTVVLEPLKMSRSHYGDLPAHEKNYAKAHATAHLSRNTPGRGYHNFLELAAAGLWTTPTDLLKAISAIQTSLHTEKGFLTRSTAHKMLTSPLSHASPHGGQWSYGWGISSTFFAHSGSNDPGYVCYVLGGHALDPSTNTSPAGGIHAPNLMSLAIMTNSACGNRVISKLVSAIFGLKQYPLYATLPGAFGKTNDFVPYATPEGVTSPDTWPLFVGEWSRCDTVRIPSRFDASCATTTAPTPSSLFTGLSPGEYEIFGHEDVPYILFDGIELPHRLRHACTPWQYVNAKRTQSVFVIDGLDMAVRMMWAEDNTGVQLMELIAGGEVIPLHRA